MIPVNNACVNPTIESVLSAIDDAFKLGKVTDLKI